MFIQYLGHSAFLIKGTKSVVVDPFNFIGYAMQRVSCDYCISSHGHFDHNAFEAVDFAAKIGEEQGLDVSGFEDIELVRIKTLHDDKGGVLRGVNYASLFKIDGVSFAHLGDIGEKENLDLCDVLKGIDVLMIPIGGKYTINASTAKAYCDKINPKIIVPMHFKTEKSTVDIDGIDAFTKLYDNCKNVDEIINFDVNEYDRTTVLVFDHSKF